jgi:Acyltransferase family
MEFTKEKTNIAKGVALCLMFTNHLYYFPDRLLNGNYYIPLIPGFDLDFYVGNFGSICVSMFIFLSGYGMFLGYARSGKNPWQYSLKKLKDFYIIYWIYFLIFVPIGLVFFKQEHLWSSPELRYSSDLLIFLQGFLGWSARYNSEWWFVRIFILLLLCLSPLYLALGKQQPLLLGIVAMSLFTIAWTLKLEYVGTLGFMFWQISFAMGILCARARFFNSNFIKYFTGSKLIWLCLLVFVFGAARFRLGAKIDFLFVPTFVYLVVRIVELLDFSVGFNWIGKYSFQIWLTHSFFCYYYFQDFIYFPRWSPLIFGLLLSTSMLSAIVIENLRFQVKAKVLTWVEATNKTG